MLRHSSIILCACAWATVAHAQASCVAAASWAAASWAAAAPARIDSAEVGTLGVAVDALAFFKDNEFDGDVVRGYSLPGFRLQPRLTYTPLREVRLEAGLHATVYEGAGKYPAYVFHDIAHWKGPQYTSGAHALPFFRAEVQLGPDAHARQFDAEARCEQGRRSRTTIVLGDIYGAEAHGIAQPLYNPELTLSDDPEAGAQVLVDRKRWHSDVWVNWQSYIYEEDTHQEAFTVGWTQRALLPHGFSVPVQLVVQHRGGEQDLPELDLGVQTIANGAAGLGYEWSPACRAGGEAEPRPAWVRRVAAEALALGCYQQSGGLWPFDAGGAFWASATADFAVGRGAARRYGGLSVKAGVFHAPHDFCSLYGSPFFGTLSVKRPDMRFDGMTTGYWAVQYGRTFEAAGRSHRGSYTLGAKADGYINRGRVPFSFGVYFRACPRFVLKRFR